MNGLDMARALVERQPGAKLIFISAYSEIAYYRAAMKLHAVSFVEKPIVLEELLAEVRRAIELIGAERRMSEAPLSDAEREEIAFLSLLHNNPERIPARSATGWRRIARFRCSSQAACGKPRRRRGFWPSARRRCARWSRIAPWRCAAWTGGTACCCSPARRRRGGGFRRSPGRCWPASPASAPSSPARRPGGLRAFRGRSRRPARGRSTAFSIRRRTSTRPGTAA